MPLQVGKGPWSMKAGRAALSWWRSPQHEQWTSNLLELTLCCIMMYVGETGASCIQGQVVTEVVYETTAHNVGIPSTIVGWKSTSRHIVQKSGVKKTKLTRCGQKRHFTT